MTEIMGAQLIAKFHNLSLGGCKNPITPQDVMPSHWRAEALKKAEQNSPRGLAKRRREAAKRIREQMEVIAAMQNKK